MNRMNPKRLAVFVSVFAAIAIAICAVQSAKEQQQRALQIRPTNPQPPATFTKDILMVTDTTNVPALFGYHLDVNWDGPVHVVTNSLQVTASSPGHTEYGVGHGMTFQRNQGYRDQVVLYCEYEKQ